ncbi:MAG TPA: helix-turn-helix domain-containing protein [Rhodothermales bacterium]|nr:helix-turn-helix domain-containing protein [Rhodothermales bacterium]
MDEDTREKIVKLARKGWANTDIAEALGLKRITVQGIRKRAGLGPGPGRNSRRGKAEATG